MPKTPETNANPKSPRRKNPLYAVIALLVVVIILLLLLLLRGCDGQTSTTHKNRDPNAAVGQFEGKTEEEIQAELDKIVEEGMFNISINSTVYMQSGTDEAELRIENIAANHHLMSVQLTRDDTGEVLYTSGIIEPGYYIQKVPLDVVLPKGSYTATAMFTAYDLETEEAVGQAGAKITIEVGS